MGKRELVVTALIWLKSDFAAGPSDSLGQVARGFIVLLRLVIHLEGAGATKDERSRDAGVARTSEGLSIM